MKVSNGYEGIERLSAVISQACNEGIERLSAVISQAWDK